MKNKIAFRELMSDLSTQLQAAHGEIDIDGASLPNVTLPIDAWRSSSNESGYYKRFRDLMTLASDIAGVRSDKNYMFQSTDHYGRHVVIANVGFGGFVAYNKLHHPGYAPVANASGISATIVGNVTLSRLAALYIKMLIKYHDYSTDIDCSGHPNYHSAKAVIDTMREGIEDKVFWASSPAYRRMMNIAVAVRDHKYFPAAAVISEFFAAQLPLANVPGDWNMVHSYLNTPTDNCSGLGGAMVRMLRLVYGPDIQCYQDVIASNPVCEVTQ